MLSITLRLMRKNLRMLIPAAIAIIIGTAFIAGTFLFSNALNASLENQFSANYGSANYLLSPAGEGDGPALTAQSLGLQKIESLPGVKGLRPDYSTMVELRTAGVSSQQVLLPMAKPASLLPLGLSQGSWPQARGEIAIPQAAAKRLGVSLGQELTVKATNQDMSADSTGSQDSAGATGNSATHQPSTVSLPMRVVGYTIDSAGAFAVSEGASVMTDPDFAAVTFQSSGSLAQLPIYQVYLQLDPATAAATATQIRDSLPAGITHIQLTSRQAAVDSQLSTMVGGISPITIVLLTFGILALFVAALVIANTFQVLIAQRRATLALLRTVGARKGQVYWSVLAEGLLLGLISSLLGVVVGSGLIAGLSFLNLSLSGSHLMFVLSPEVVWVPLLFGVLMTVLACLGSARSATRVSPLEALRPLEVTEKSTVGPVRWVFGSLFILVGLGLAAVSLQATRSLMASVAADPSGQQDSQGYTMAILLAVLACMILFIGLLLLAVKWMPLLMRGFGALVSHINPAGAIAHGNVQKNPRRVAATGAALLIGVTLVTTLATGASSAKLTMDNALSGNYSVDMTVSQGGDLRAALSAVKAVKGIAQAALLQTADVTLINQSGQTVSAQLVAIDQTQAKRLLRADIGDGLAQGALVISSKALRDGMETVPADGADLRVESVGSATDSDLTGQDGSDQAQSQADDKPVKVADLPIRLENFTADMSGQVTALISPSLFRQYQAKLGPVQEVVWIRVADSAQPLQTFSDVQDAISKHRGGLVSGPIAQRIQWNQTIDLILALMVGLLAVAVIIALIGVANTLSLSVIERTRESATLRAIGMTRGQLRSSLAWEALVIALVSALAGLVLGTAFGWLGATVVLWPVGQVAFSVSWGIDIGILLIAALAALVSSVAPARRAVRTAPVEALAEA